MVFAAKLRAQGLPVITYNIREYFASINLERQHKQQPATAKQESAIKKD
ncbi:unnamed protein product [Wuchereria bancrofti]|uniref:Uncharacterized protein n=1 Tax=Wuchereria bancrofti TaxID=6293 RepID=A0A3P7DVD4_WUCBA|nr:unnamed protein product [Wuchereria bancrofti]